MQQTLSWTNQNSLTSFPLSQSFLFDDFIVDANWIQFDNFEPVFVRVIVSSIEVEVVFLTDAGEQSIFVSASAFEPCVVLRTSDLRYLGTVTFGAGVAKLCEEYSNNTIEANIPFLPTVVKSIYSGGGVYSLQGLFGAITALPGDVTYAVDENAVTLNCVTKMVIPGTPFTALKTINGITPVNNSLIIHEGELLKFSPTVGTLFVDVSNNGSDITAPKKYQLP